jgi:pimeloyl-ACP methyl ester carboxylesterase
MRTVRFTAVLACLAVLAAACGDGRNDGVTATASASRTDSSTVNTPGTDSGNSSQGRGPGSSCQAQACVTVATDSAQPGGSGDTAADPTQAAFGWEIAGSPLLQTGHLKVPIDYNDPSKGSITLFVARRKALDPAKRIGTLLVNPGGPGFGGSEFALLAGRTYSAALLQNFDIVGWDPRGTGKSTPAIDCIDNYDKYFASTDITPDNAAERQTIIDLAKEFETNCVTKNAAILQYVGTNNSARDMDSIRQALGEKKISYFGFSYGSELGATWATLFPDTVRAAVLDGASDPKADFLTSGLQQSAGFEHSISTFLQHCSATRTCAFYNGGKAEKAFDALMLAIDNKPIPSESGRPDVTRGVALTAVAMAMYSQSFWPELEAALASAQNGDGAGLLGLYDSYYQRQSDGTYDNSLEAFQTISCMDSPERLTIAQDDASAAKFIAIAPRFAPGTTGSYFCTFFPPAQDPRIEITGKGAGKILVVGTTGDPATPLSSTQNMAKALEGGVLMVVKADQHTGYSLTNRCVRDGVDNYLVQLQVPAIGTTC